MSPTPHMQPLSLPHRRRTFLVLVGLFVVALPFLFLYAVGYRFDFSAGTGLVPTGGIYVAAERTGAEIYIDGELVRQTRAFRRAFYAQGLEPGTHRVHVQKEGHHTWVKELPVYPYLVTEAQAFNLPLVSDVRVISPWRTAEGVPVLSATSTINASTTNTFTVDSRVTPLTSWVADTEYATLLELFKSSNNANTKPATIVPIFTPSTDETDRLATTTKEQGGARLFLGDDDVFAEWIGSRQQMPYYYCAAAFELAGATPESEPFYEELEEELKASDGAFIGPVQSVPEDATCDPVIRLDRGEEAVHSFDFYPDSTDLVILGLKSGIYVVEVDNRAWQNKQPLIEGADLDFRVYNGAVYIYDGEYIYQIILGT